MASGFVDRLKGKSLTTASSLTQFGSGGALFKGGGNIYVNSPAGGLGNPSNTSTNVLDSYTLAGNSLSANGYMLTLQAFGLLAANTHVKTVAMNFGSESATFSNSTSLTGGTPWMLSMQVFKTGSNTQFVTTQAIQGTTHDGIVSQTDAAAEADTAGIVINVTGQTATAGANDILLYGWYIEEFNY